MKKTLLIIVVAFIAGHAYAGTPGGFIAGRVTKTCRKDATAAYQQGYRDAISDCKNGKINCGGGSYKPKENRTDFRSDSLSKVLVA